MLWNIEREMWLSRASTSAAYRTVSPIAIQKRADRDVFYGDLSAPN
jgi:hypothetical protein